MEKNKPSCPLSKVKTLVQAGKVRFTITAQMDAKRMGFAKTDIAEEILCLESREFYKSMTTYRDAAVWQDVYRHHSRAGMLYVKLTVIADVLVVSFKEL